MKTSLDLPDDLYRRVKSKSALEGLAVREVAAALFSAWVDGRLPANLAHEPSTDAVAGIADPRQQWHDRWRELAARVSAASAEPGALVDQLRNDRR